MGSAPTGKHALSLACVFHLGHFLRSKIESESIFLKKYYIITFLYIKKNWSVLPIFNKVKKWITHCIFKSCAEGFSFFFKDRKLFFGQMACIYLLNSRGVPKVLISTSHIFYPSVVTPYYKHIPINDCWIYMDMLWSIDYGEHKTFEYTLKMDSQVKLKKSSSGTSVITSVIMMAWHCQKLSFSTYWWSLI